MNKRLRRGLSALAIGVTATIALAACASGGSSSGGSSDDITKALKDGGTLTYLARAFCQASRPASSEVPCPNR